MEYRYRAIHESDIPRAALPLLQHAIDTYASEINKVWYTWRHFTDYDLEFKPHEKSMSTIEAMRHQIRSERRFFAEFFGFPEPAESHALPEEQSVAAYSDRLADLAQARIRLLALQLEPWWLQEVRFFDVRRQRIWIFWRRILHTAHHRAQLSLYLRLLDKPVPSIYGPTADDAERAQAAQSSR